MVKNKIFRLFLLLVVSAGFDAFAVHTITENTVFNILSYNAQMRPILDDNHHKAPRISMRLNKFDIAALQESFCMKDELMQGCLHPFRAHFTDKCCCLSLVDSGLSTLSYFPIIEVKKEHFRARAGFQDIIASKGILLTRMVINGCVVDIYNTHMQAGDAYGGTLARMDQAKQIFQFVTENSPTAHSVILIGDFNMSPQRFARDVAQFKQKGNIHPEEEILRNFTFSMLQESLNLVDLSDHLLPHEVNDCDRILFRSGSEHELRPLSFEKPIEYFKDEHLEPLSDGAPIVGTFSISVKYRS